MEFHIMSKLNYALAFAALAVAALFFLPGKDDAQNAVQNAHNDRCAAFAAAGVEC